MGSLTLLGAGYQPVAASSPIAFVDGVTTASANGTDVTSATINSTGANFLVAVVSDYDPDAAGSVTDSKGNTWNAGTIYHDGLMRVHVFWSKPSSVGSSHTASYTGTIPAIGFAAFSNVNASPFDSEVGATGDSTSPAGGTVTPSADGALIISGVSFFDGDTSPVTVNSSFVIVGSHIERTGNHMGLDMAYFIQTTAAAKNPVWTELQANKWAATNTVFKN